MKVVFIGKSHEFSLVPFAAVHAKHQIVGIVESGPRGKPSLLQRLKLQVKGIISAFDGKSLHWLARRDKVPYLWLDARTRHGIDAFLQKCQPDILVVASLSYLLSERTLSLPAHGAINLHPSMLPKYHGPFPWLWQYLNDEPEIGITVHKLDAGQDTGPIVRQAALPLPRGAELIGIQARVAQKGAKLICQALDDIATGTARFVPQSLDGHAKARIVHRDEPLIDWVSWPIERVWHALRGAYPWLDPIDCPAPLKNGRYRVGNFENGCASGIAGHVGKDERGYFVAHGQGKIRLCSKDERAR